MEKQKTAWRQAGFELAVRLAKFGFEISTEFRALVAQLTFRENFTPEVLDENIRLVQVRRQGLLMNQSGQGLSQLIRSGVAWISARSSICRTMKSATSARLISPNRQL